MTPNLVGCGRVKNGLKYVDRWVGDMLALCNSVCILDDGSDDGTTQRLLELSKLSPQIFIHLQRNLPRHGGRDCRILYDMAGALKADWIFAPDIDEFIDPEDMPLFQSLVELPEDQDDILGWTFPFFYLWDHEKQYRIDGDYADCHVIRLFKYDSTCKPADRPSHSQVCPDELDRRRIRRAPVRMVHYGYMDAAERQAKYEYYTKRDADPLAAGGGVKDYNHIIGAGDLRPYPSRQEWCCAD